MTIVGHFDNLAEAQKLTQSRLMQGVIQEIIEEGGLVSRLPVTQIDGKSLLYNRESTLPSGQFYDIHEQLPWSTGHSFTQVEATLKRIARQDILDKFVSGTYKNINDYKSIIVSSLRKGVMRTVEDKLIYGNATTNSKEFDGLHALTPAAQSVAQGSSSTGAALSLAKLRTALDLVRAPGDDTSTGARSATFILTTRAIATRIDATTFPGLSTNAQGNVSFGINDIGQRVSYFDGVPIIRSDFLTMTEVIASSTFSTKTGGATGSLFIVRTAGLMEGGLNLCVGSGSGGGPEIFNMTEFESLEDFDAAGLRLTAYLCTALGSTKSIARIDGITDVAAVI